MRKMSQQNYFFGGGWTILKNLRSAYYKPYDTLCFKRKGEQDVSLEDHAEIQKHMKTSPSMLRSIPTLNLSCFVWCLPLAKGVSASQPPHLSRPKRLRWTIRHWGNDQRSNFLLWQRCSLCCDRCGFDGWHVRHSIFLSTDNHGRNGLW